MPRKRKGSFLRLGKIKPGLVTDGQVTQPIARINPHNANRRYFIPNRFVKKADV